MRICMLARSLPCHSIGGLEVHTFELCKGLAQTGVDLTIITTRHPEGVEHETTEGIKIYYLKDSSPGSYFGGYWPASRLKVKELQAQSPFDLIHSQSVSAHYLLKEQNIPMVVSMHGTAIDEIATYLSLIKTDPFSFFGYFGKIINRIRHYLRVEKPLLSRAKAVIATSHEQFELLRRFYFLAPNKIFKVFNGTSLELFLPQPKPEDLLQKYNFSSGQIIILAAARLELEKGIQYIIKALPQILKQLPETRLLILGEGSSKKYLQKLVSKLNLSEYVVFAGSVSLTKLPAYFNLCDIFVNATIRQNGYDLTCLEAMACERPVVASNIGSMPTLISDNRDGILITPGNVRSVTRGIAKVLSDRTLAHRLGQRARAKTINLFSLKQMAEGTKKVYDTILEN